MGVSKIALLFVEIGATEQILKTNLRRPNKIQLEWSEVGVGYNQKTRFVSPRSKQGIVTNIPRT